MTADGDAVRSTVAAFDDAFERRDLAAVLELCTEDIVFIGSGEGEEAVGRDAIGPMFAGLAPQLASSEFTFEGWDELDVDVRGDVALVFGSGPATLRTPSRSTTFRYRMTGVLLRVDGRWLWRVHHGSEPGAW